MSEEQRRKVCLRQDKKNLITDPFLTVATKDLNFGFSTQYAIWKSYLANSLSFLYFIGTSHQSSQIMQRDQIFKLNKSLILEFLNSRHYIVIKNRCDTSIKEVIKRINVLSLLSLIIILPFKTSEKI